MTTRRPDFPARRAYNPAMKIDGLDRMDWLHKARHEAEEKRVRDGLSIEEWLPQSVF